MVPEAGAPAALLTPGRRPDEIAAITVLTRGGGLPVDRLASIVDHLGSAVEALAMLCERRLPPFISPQLPLGGIASADVERARRDVDSWLAAGLDIRTVLDPGYPESLHSIFNRPPMLFVEGTWKQEADYRSVAVVGTRQATQQGLQSARRLATELALEGYTIVSGLARGIDTAAHEAALAAGARTVAVLGSGLRRIYPAENLGLARRIVAAGGALVSQFFPEHPPAKWTFPKRNVVMSGLSLATVVVEASETSGARTQARIALEHGRSVFLPSSLVAEHEWARQYVEEGLHGARAVAVGSTREMLDRLQGRVPAAAAVSA
jgi:DNA processing protein